MTQEEAYKMMDQAKAEGVDPQEAVQQFIKQGYAIEGLNADFNAGEMLSNVIPSAKRMVSDIYHTFRKDGEWVIGETVKGLGKLGKALGEDVLANYVGREMSDESYKIMQGLSQAFADRYGTTDQWKKGDFGALINTVEKDPIGFLSDASFVASSGGALAKGAAKLGKITGLDRASRTAAFLDKAGEIGVKTGRVLEPTLLVTEALPKVTKLAIRKGAGNWIKSSKMGKWLEDNAVFMAQKAGSATEGDLKNLSKRVYNERVGETAARFGIHGTPGEMAEQSRKLATYGKNQVDIRLKGLRDTYQNRAIENALSELNAAFVDNADLPAKAKKFFRQNMDNHLAGQKAGAGALIPQTEAITNMIENVAGQIKSPKLAQDYRDIGKLIQTYGEHGLTLTEANAIKRKFDKFLPSPYQKNAAVSGIGSSDFVKAGMKSQGFDDLRKGLRGFIEDSARRSGQPDIRKYNDMTRWGTEFGDMMEDVSLTFRDRINQLDSLILISGVTGSILTTSVKFLMTAAGITFGRNYIKSPKFASAVAQNMMLLRGKQYDDVVRAIQTGKHTRQSKQTFRKMARNLQAGFPAVRIAGKVATGASGEF
jgi:hypothetical protein